MSDLEVRKCTGKEVGVSYAVVLFLLIWVVAEAILGVVLSIQNDPPQSLRDAVFWFSVVTFPVLVLGLMLWRAMSRCSLEQACRLEPRAAPALASV
jgi:hypothetical protein